MAVTTSPTLPPAVGKLVAGLQHLVELSRTLKRSDTIDPPLSLENAQAEVESLNQILDAEVLDTQASTVLEIAARQTFYRSLDHCEVVLSEGPAVDIWNLLDILLILAERRQSGRAIVWYLLEELVESQTAVHCRHIFDYLESRRERLTQREFQVTHLIILRTCNELLRRLSRAEDATFCGRVYFFLFQIFPLGEQSSVNLRGEFHVENVTILDTAEADAATTNDAMVIDDDATAQPTKAVSDPTTEPGRQADPNFYTRFWNLQKDFSIPTRLIEDDEHFAQFKKGLEDTVEKFESTSVVATRSSSDQGRQAKRRRMDGSNDYEGKYNPKYLTSRQLFSLELSDLSFQRHILIQALILLDFLLSLSESALLKLDKSGVPRVNQSVNYGYTLPKEKRQWAQALRNKIGFNLSQGPDGKFYNRMVNTVLARDKNWIWWKIQRCPPIVKDAVPAREWVASKDGVQQAAANKRIKSKPMGAMDLGFLADAQSRRGLDGLQTTDRYRLPSQDELVSRLATEELDLDFATDAEKEDITARMGGISWRLVRTAARTSLAKFDSFGNKSALMMKALGTEKKGADGDGVVNGDGDTAMAVDSHKTSSPEAQVA